MNQPDTQRRSWIPVLLPPVAVAALLRGLGLEGQVLADDELHSVHAALTLTVGQIFGTFTFGGADYGVPLTAFSRFLMDRGVTFSEWTFRFPSLLAGLAAVIVLPRLAAPRVGRFAAIALAWLIAISPMLVFYSRIIRPYMVTALLASCAALLFDRWRRDRSLLNAVAVVVTSAFAVYTHLAAAPLVAGMFFFEALALWRDTPPRGTRVRELAQLGLATLLGVALLALPGIGSLLEVVETTRGGWVPSPATWLDVTRLELGTSSVFVGLAASLVLARGVFVLWRSERDLVLYLATLIASQVVGLILLAPDRLEERMVLSRYMLVVLPLALLVLGVGATARWWPGERRGARRVETIVAIAGLLALLVSGPLIRPFHRESSFSHMLTSLDFLSAGNRMPAEFVPAFYTELAAFDERPLIEYPWQNMSAHAFDAYQRVHRQPVYVSSVIDRSDEPRLALRNRVEPRPEAMLASPARYVVVHLDLESEARRLASSDPNFEKWLLARDKLWIPLRRAGTSMSDRLSRAFGPPEYIDSTIAVWDLDTVREQEAPRP